MPVTVPCTRCGGPMELSPELVALANGAPISMTHGDGLCPADAEGPAERRWRCEVRVVEVVTAACDVEDDCQGHEEHELFASFADEQTAATLQKALPLLADGIGRQWEQAIEHAPFADQPVVCSAEGCDEPAQRGTERCAKHPAEPGATGELDARIDAIHGAGAAAALDAAIADGTVFGG